jgi:hypothetical protein
MNKIRNVIDLLWDYNLASLYSIKNQKIPSWLFVQEPWLYDIYFFIDLMAIKHIIDADYR